MLKQIVSPWVEKNVFDGGYFNYAEKVFCNMWIFWAHLIHAPCSNLRLKWNYILIFLYPSPIPSAILPISINNNFFPLQVPKLKIAVTTFSSRYIDYNLLWRTAASHFDYFNSRIISSPLALPYVQSTLCTATRVSLENSCSDSSHFRKKSQMA